MTLLTEQVQRKRTSGLGGLAAIPWRTWYLSRASENSFPFVELRMEKALHVVRTATVKTRWDLTRRSYFHRYRIRLLRNPPSAVYWPGSFPAPKQLEKPVCAILLGLCWITDSEPLKIAPGREDAARWNGNR